MAHSLTMHKATANLNEKRMRCCIESAGFPWFLKKFKAALLEKTKRKF